MKSVSRRLSLAICLALAGPPVLLANPAEDGDATVSAGTPVLNAYTTIVSHTTTTITVAVGGAAALTLPACPGTCAGATVGNGFGTALATGDLLMIYQPQELAGTITTTDGAAFGAATFPADYGQAGLYEFAYVASVAGDVITIVTDAGGDPCTGLKNTYDAGAMVIRVPQLRNLTVTGGSITAPAWNGSTGGVVALDVRPGVPTGDLGAWVAANGTTTIEVANGINVSGLGFRGGSIDNTTVTLDRTIYRSTNCAEGGRKGESILGWAGSGDTAETVSAACAALIGPVAPTGSYVGQQYGRGALANGGGGGNATNAGGGGGANGGAVGAWNGAGNPVAGFDSIWFLEDDIAQTGEPLACSPSGSCAARVTSSGGGRGGYSWASVNRDETTEGPADPDWGGNLRRIRGGLGGRPLDRGTDRFYFGGGGGAGDRNNSQPSAGGAGGGLVFLITQRLVSSTPASVLIRADGAVGLDSAGSGAQDGPGGGGGGGTIVLQSAREIMGVFRAAGGVGGQQTGAIAESEGPGGGGGGGVIAASFLYGAPVFQVDGAAGGLSSSTSVPLFMPNGATAGGAGETTTAPGSASPVYQCMIGDGGTFTTDAGHAFFHGRSTGDGNLQVEFVSTFELGNSGYYIEGERNGVTERASAMIPRTPGEAEKSRTYSLSIRDLGWDRLWLVEVDARGETRRRGPFQPGVASGVRPADVDYDWTAAQADYARHVQGAPRGTSSAAYLEVSQAGMQRVTHEQLLAAGIDFSGTPAGELALSDRKGVVQRKVSGGATFGPGSAIEFYGDPQADLYKSTHTYLVERTTQTGRVLQFPVRGRAESNGAFLAQPSPAIAESRHTTVGNYYDPVSPTSTPWYMYELFANAGAPVSQSMPIAAPGAAGGAGTILLGLSGFVDLDPGAQPDHHVRVYLNNTLVADDRFDGIVPRDLEIPVSNVQASNIVRVELPGDTGHDYDMIAIHSLKLRYATTAQLSGGRFNGHISGSVGQRSDRFFADSFGDVVSGDGIPVEQQVVIAGRTATSRTFVVGPRSVAELEADPDRAFNGSQALSPASTIWVGDTVQMLAPAISVAPDLQALPTGSAQWLAISHGMFLTQAETLAAHRRTQGLTAQVVPVEQLYRRYTAGNAHPDAITQFLRERAGALQVDYLVMVGSANYNSVGLRGSGVSTLSHIPTHYARTNRFVNFAPTDARYGDLTGDLLVEFPVGRLPVRTQAEATEAVRKLIAYESQAASGKVLLSSGTYDTQNSFSFMQSVDQLAGALPLSWDKSRADVEAVGTNPARTALMDAINQGRSVITYTGHSSPITWDAVGGGSALLSVSDLGTLPSNVNQPAVLQFGCWTTYFVSPVVNTLGTALINTPSRGASSVFGSTVLLDQPSHDRFGSKVAPRLQSTRRLGDVIEEARQELATTEDPLAGAEVRLGITLLGDPASVIH